MCETPPSLSTPSAPLEHLRKDWPALVEKCRQAQPLLQHILRDSWPVAVNNTTLQIGFDPEFAEEIESVRMAERGALQNLFHAELGHTVHLEFVVLREPVRWSHQTPQSDTEAVAPEKPFSPETAGLSRREWQRNESIRLVLETFHGDIIDIQL